jgi:hypothetical protein
MSRNKRKIGDFFNLPRVDGKNNFFRPGQMELLFFYFSGQMLKIIFYFDQKIRVFFKILFFELVRAGITKIFNLFFSALVENDFFKELSIIAKGYDKKRGYNERTNSIL